MILILMLISSFAFAEQSITINGQQIITAVQSNKVQIQVLKNKKIVSTVAIPTQKDPKILKLEIFQDNEKSFVLADYSLGYTFGSRKETTCYRATLWELTKDSTLVKKSEVDYKCEVNTSDDYLKEGEYDYKYRLNKKSLKLEFY